ncbi:MAG: formate/nitrite transporter family protein [Lachnospiraceae bacterium]|nr:formate/nitrite transporter family protein [Lachnospiraceae bacterium]MCI9101488.1 formate/nitrite transporter family protein [Lachnospiraceae bacterium]MCI9357571.1 formate/nitrite transporter family protein [Lachnospiraceae bacterium]
MNSPAEIAKNYVPIGKGKANMKASKLFVLGILAGIFIAIAGVGASTASTSLSGSVGKLVGACVFPAGLTLVILAGSELFTGNCLIIISVLEKEASVVNMLRNWVIVYLGNFVGSIFVAWGVSACHQLSLFDNALGGATINTAVAKVSMSFGDAFLKGVFCNMLVCLAVWLGFSSKTAAGKIAALFYPIMVFVLSGFEHSVANMFYGPAGLFAMGNADYLAAATADTAKLTWGAFFVKNLIPVTLGNIVGGAVLVGMVYWFIYLKKDKES